MPITRVIRVDPDDPDRAALLEAAAVLRAGGLVAFATETVYGLGADATHPEAVARIFDAKGRPATNPLIVHVARKVDALRCVSHWPDRAEILADRFWPGPLTLVLPRSGIIPDIVTAGLDTVGVRVPRPRLARLLIHRAGCPVAAPSANRSTGVSPTRAEHVLKDLDGQVDLILDGGPTAIGLESTVLDLSGPRPAILRPGWITEAMLEEALGETITPSAPHPGTAGFRSPGQMAIHYAPRKAAYRVEPHSSRAQPAEGRYALMTFGEVVAPRPQGPARHIHLKDPEVASGRFYDHLHGLDAAPDLDFLLIIPPPDEPRWRAVRDRIQRATRPWPPG